MTMTIDFSKLITAESKFATAKEGKSQQVNRLRDEKEASGFPYLGKTFDSDERSASRIFGAVQAAQAAVAAGQPFVIDWTVQDNSVLTLDAQETIGMSVAMAQYANGLHQHARALKSQVDGATNTSELEAIDIESGWTE